MILVTGGTGLLGSHLLIDLLKKGKEIRVISRIGEPSEFHFQLLEFYGLNPKLLDTSVEWVKGDVTDITSIEEAFKGVDLVYHCAAIVSFSPKLRKKMFEVNVNGTANVVNLTLANKIKRLCYISSTAAIGKKGNEELVVEDDEWHREMKSTNYSKSKFLAEREVWRGKEEGLEVVVINPCIVLGPGNWHLSSGIMFKNVNKGMKFYTSGSNGFVDVRDVIRVMQTLHEKNITGERFLVIGENLPFRTVFNYISDAFDKPRPFKFANKFLTGIGWRIEKIKSILTGKSPRLTKEMAQNAQIKIAYSNEKVKKAIGFEFTPIEETVKFSVDYCKKYMIKS